MKKTSENSNNRKHLHIHKLNNSQLQVTSGGKIITCGIEGDLCEKLSAVTGFVHETHKVVVT